jgi:hypothetical protein
LLHGSDHELAGWTLSVLHPAQDTIDVALARYANNQRVNLNDLSASLLVRRDKVALVLGADGEAAAWTAVDLRMRPADLRHTRPVKVPHHGSRGAIHRVLIDPARRDAGRPQVVTPFPSSGRLPRFDVDHGVERLLAAAGQLDLTAMPVDLVARGSASVALADVRAAMTFEDFEGDPALRIRPEQPSGTSQLAAATRDPYEAWVMLGVHLDGTVDIVRGAHALRVTE